MESIRWRIKVTDPLKYRIKGLPNWFLINPGVILDQSTPHFENNHYIPINKQEAMIIDNKLSFLVKKESRIQP